MDFLYTLASAILVVLPDSPFATDGFTATLDKFSTIMANINYFIPFNDMFLFMGVYLLCVIIWYGARWILRFVRYIDNGMESVCVQSVFDWQQAM